MTKNPQIEEIGSYINQQSCNLGGVADRVTTSCASSSRLCHYIPQRGKMKTTGCFCSIMFMSMLLVVERLMSVFVIWLNVL